MIPSSFLRQYRFKHLFFLNAQSGLFIFSLSLSGFANPSPPERNASEARAICTQLSVQGTCSPQALTLLEPLKILCEQKSRDLGCPQLFEVASTDEKARYLNCDEPKDRCELMTESVQKCAESGAEAVVEYGSRLLTLPGRLWQELGQFPARFSRCQEDEDFKKSLLGVFRPPGMTNETVRRMSCADIRRFVEVKVSTLSQRVEARLLRAQTNQRSPQNLTLSDFVVNEQEHHAVNFFLTENPRYRHVACYRPSEKLKFICSELASLAASASVGAGAGAVAGNLARRLRGTPSEEARGSSPNQVSLQNQVSSRREERSLQVPVALKQRFPNMTFVRRADGVYEARNGRTPLGTFDVIPNGNELYVYKTLIPDETARSSGIGGALFRAILEDNPGIRTIRTDSLIDSNRLAFDQARARGLSMVEALRQTPAYRIRASEGFTEIVPGSIDSESLGFTVRRPQPRTNSLPADSSTGATTLILAPQVEEVILQND